MYKRKYSVFTPASQSQSFKRFRYAPYAGRISRGYGRASAPTTAAQVRAIVRRTILDTKEKIINDDVVLQESGLQSLNVLGNIPIGAGETSRAGDCINVQSIQARISFSNYGSNSINANDTVTFRCFWIKTNQQFLSGFDAFGTSLPPGTVFFNSGANLALAGIPDPDKCTILADRTYEISPTLYDSVGNLPNSVWKTVYFNCPIPKTGMRMQYQSPTADYGKIFNVYLLVVASSPYVGPLTNVGTVNAGIVVRFTDSK